MKVCCCSLAGTKACEGCPNNTNYVGLTFNLKKQIEEDNIKEWNKTTKGWKEIEFKC
ncbi:MAG: hypothetical protein PHN69_02500 [Candidatus Pacebacteria bacterium]|nr:hypothetical protein [Candidatus Paceibacterota bacterium]